jgi:hypothetical protein
MGPIQVNVMYIVTLVSVIYLHDNLTVLINFW